MYNDELILFGHICDVTNLSMSGADHLHPLVLGLGLQQRGVDGVLNSLFHIFWRAL